MPPPPIDARSAAEAALREALCATFIIGRQRTQEQDAEFAIHQLVEIAVRENRIYFSNQLTSEPLLTASLPTSISRLATT